MQKLFLVMCFILIGVVSRSQDFEPGYVVNQAGDTLRGLIENRKWDSSPLIISFKADAGSTKLEYRPENIKSFYVGGERYESASVDEETSSHELSKLDESRAPKFVRSNVFLQILVDGNKTLALYKNKRDLYYIMVDGKFQALVYKQFLIDKKYIMENKEYLGTLNVYLQNCPDIASRLKNTKYNTKALVKLFREYYLCAGDRAKYTTDKKETSLEYGFILGASFATVGFGPASAGYDYLTRGSFSTAVGPVIGGYFDLKLLRSAGIRMRITNDIFYTSFAITGRDDVSFNAPADMKFNYSYIKTHDMLRYNILKSGALYGAGGLSLAVALNSDIQLKSPHTFSGTVEPKSFELGYVLGLGSQMGKLSLETRYEYSNGTVEYPGSRTLRFYFILRYPLSKE